MSPEEKPKQLSELLWDAAYLYTHLRASSDKPPGLAGLVETMKYDRTTFRCLEEVMVEIDQIDPELLKAEETKQIDFGLYTPEQLRDCLMGRADLPERSTDHG